MTEHEHRAVTADWAARQKVSLDELSSHAGALWWLQGWPDGTTRLMRSTGTAAAVPVSPPGFSIGGWLHAYGGGGYAIEADGTSWLIRSEDSGVYRLSGDGASTAAREGDGACYGDLSISDEGVLAVRGTERGDEIVRIRHDGQDAEVLASSRGFLAAPRMRGRQLAFLEWDEGQMPWDASRLLVAEPAANGQARRGRVIAGSGHESVVQPAWGPGGDLYYLSDRSGYWNLYRWDGELHHPVAPIDRDCAPAPWEAGYQSYAFLPDGSIPIIVHDGLSHCLAIAREGQTLKFLDTPLTSAKPYVAALGGRIAVIGADPVVQPAVVTISPHSAALARIPQAGDPPEAGTVTAERGRTHGDDGLQFLLHRPSGDMAVPLIVRAHPGPTDEVKDRLDWTKEFFVRHGFAVAEVAYRGSAGLGRQFRTSLNGNWGDYDVQDCLAVARYLVDAGIADPRAVFVSGSSAGGYTALQAACVPGTPVTAVTAISAITDPGDWARSAPRFQRAHARTLAGPAGTVRAARVRVPVLLIHGRKDEIAPASAAQALAADLSGQDERHRSLFFDGAGHYLSGPGVLSQALQAELGFYQAILGG
ncbi:MAG TPA: prolyl oligopeptidase family serine peptidase [Streptosporangiaceae bacterium]|jgi:dipeptidyl aminopeptidase/acylaminoacyl peptidase|nr:prolyl oligopeptidase family serine peptidase [Streptosporangiaceae bacterium]